VSDGPLHSKVARECPHCLEPFVDMILIPLANAQGPLLPERVTRTEIENDGMAGEVVRLRAEGRTMEEIAEITKYNRYQIQRFLQNFQTMLPQQRQTVIERSIFNIAAELQSNYTDLIGMIDQIVENPELELRVRTEMRKNLEFAARVVDRLEQLKRDAEHKEAILKILDKFSPGAYAEAMREITQYRQSLNMER